MAKIQLIGLLWGLQKRPKGGFPSRPGRSLEVGGVPGTRSAVFVWAVDFVKRIYNRITDLI